MQENVFILDSFLIVNVLTATCDFLVYGDRLEAFRPLGVFTVKMEIFQLCHYKWKHFAKLYLFFFFATRTLLLIILHLDTILTNELITVLTLKWVLDDVPAFNTLEMLQLLIEEFFLVSVVRDVFWVNHLLLHQLTFLYQLKIL